MKTELLEVKLGVKLNFWGVKKRHGAGKEIFIQYKLQQQKKTNKGPIWIN
jgi:hypothetical protein